MSGMQPAGGGSDAAGSVVFIGAGPGAPGLLTLDAVEALRAADLVLYADSLVSPELARFLRPGVPFEGTKERHLDAIAARMIAAARAGQRVARVHSGDPALYGAITEQIALLRQADVPYRIIPGVSSVFAAAAALGVELTVPDVAQTIIMTRAAGRTGMPAGESLRALAAHGTTLAILLGITRIRQLVADLLAGGYAPETPAAALYRVSWPDEAIVRGTLADLATAVKAAGWSRQALILVGRAIDPALQDGAHRSHLYAATYSHRFRRADGRPPRDVSGTPAAPIATSDDAVAPVVAKTVGATRADRSLVLVALTKGGTALGARLATALGGTLYAPERFAGGATIPYEGHVADLVGNLWAHHDGLVLLMPVGVAVRAIAPLLTDKRTDPGIVALDEGGRYAVSVAGGHLGGANALAREVARIVGSEAVITTGSDVRGLPALDLLGSERGWTVANPDALTGAAAALVNGERVAAFQEAGSRAWLSHPEAAALDHVARIEDLGAPTIAAALVVTHRRGSALPPEVQDKATTVIYHPPCLSIGLGCERGVSERELAAAVEGVLADHGLALAAVRELASIDVKRDEAGLLAYVTTLSKPIRFFGAAELNRVPVRNPSPAALAAVGAHGVAEPAALLAGGTRTLLVQKVVHGRVTVAVALREETDD